MARWMVVLLVAVGCIPTDEAQRPLCRGCISEHDSASLLGLCAICTSDGDCDSGVCRQYGDGRRKCSRTCEASEPAPTCTAPATGGCNGMGYCMCPPLAPPHDAGAGDGPAMDAPLANGASVP